MKRVVGICVALGGLLIFVMAGQSYFSFMEAKEDIIATYKAVKIPDPELQYNEALSVGRKLIGAGMFIGLCISAVGYALYRAADKTPQKSVN